MGHAFIVYVYRDGIERADYSRSEWRKISAALGEGTLQVCLEHAGPRAELDKAIDNASQAERLLPAMRVKAAEQLESLRRARSDRITSAPVANHVNCVVRCDEVHSTDSRLYLWSGNCLRPVHQIDAEDLDIVARLIEDERQRRRGAT